MDTLVTESLVKHSPCLKLSLAADLPDVPNATPYSLAWKCPKDLEWQKRVIYIWKKLFGSQQAVKKAVFAHCSSDPKTKAVL